MKNFLVLKYPTLWNMREFIEDSIIFSIWVNGLIGIPFYFNLAPILLLGILVLIVYIISLTDNNKKNIKSFNIFDKNKLSPYKEYFIYFFSHSFL